MSTEAIPPDAVPCPVRRPLSSQLARLAATFGARPVRLGELIEVLQARGWNAVILLLALPFVIPVPLMGFSTVFGAIIAFLGMQMALARWPSVSERFRRRELPARMLPRLLLAGSRLFARLEKHMKPRFLYPRFPVQFQRCGGALVGMCGLLLLLPLPIPFSNSLPAIAIVLIAAAGLARDGVVFLAGCVQVVLCVGFFGLLAFGGMTMLQKVLP